MTIILCERQKGFQWWWVGLEVEFFSFPWWSLWMQVDGPWVAMQINAPKVCILDAMVTKLSIGCDPFDFVLIFENTIEWMSGQCLW